MTTFRCERVNLDDAERDDCQDCIHYDQCVEDGYLSEIDKKLGLDKKPTSENTAKRNFARKLHRIFNAGYLKRSKKHQYELKRSGANVDFGSPAVEFDKEAVKDIVGRFGLESQLEDIFGATKNYLIDLEIWNAKALKPGELIERVKRVQGRAHRLASELDTLDHDTLVFITRKYGGLDTLHGHIHVFQNTLADAIDEFTLGKGGLADLPLSDYIQALKTIYENVTGKKAAVSFNADHQSSSPFFKFAYSIHKEITS